VAFPRERSQPMHETGQGELRVVAQS
jgi:hypothetical protein